MTEKTLPTVIAVVGPTAIGKTSLGIALAKKLGGEVISGDSRQVYRGLTIGTGKVTAGEMEGVPHYLIDVADLEVQFTAHEYVHRGREAISDIFSRGKTPIIVGGTGMYIDALVGRIALARVEPNKELRKELEVLPLENLQDKLRELDPERFKTIDTKNPRRLVRAIEIAMTEHSETEPVEPLYNVRWIGLALPREELQKRIVNRLHQRLAEGMLEEAVNLHAHGLSYERMEELGLEYRYMARHLQGRISFDEMIQALELEIYKYSKRQMTWFKKNKEIEWFDATHPELALALFS